MGATLFSFTFLFFRLSRGHIFLSSQTTSGIFGPNEANHHSTAAIHTFLLLQTKSVHEGRGASGHFLMAAFAWS